MKQKLFFLHAKIFFALLFLPALAWSQTAKEITADTSYIEWDVIPSDWTGADDSIWYETKITTYSGGRTETIRQPVGDTATLVGYFANRNVDLNRQLAQAALITIQRAAVVRANRVSDRALTARGLPSIFPAFDTLFWREYLNDRATGPDFTQNYTVLQNGTQYAATMRRLGNGNIRLSWNGNNYRIIIYSDTWVRINNYPVQGQDTDLFRTGRIEWTTVNGTNQGNRIIPNLVLRKAR